MNENNKAIKFYDNISTIPSTISICGAINNTPIPDFQKLDEIDATCQETFTLEEMRILILSHRKKNKDFIIARITTQDASNTNSLHNFYYAASEINRILFKYEPSRRLLHRMKVKNPLNNQYIIGQVFYYKITSYEVDNSIVDYLYNTKKEIIASKKSFSAIFKKKRNLNLNLKKQKSKDSMDIETNRINMKNDSSLNARDIIGKMIKNKVPVPKVNDETRKIQFNAIYFASDDDFLTKQEIRDYFKSNALEAEDEFIYDINRAHSEMMIFLEDDSQNTSDEEISEWRRVMAVHISFVVGLFFTCLCLGGLPGIIIFFLPLIALIILSFTISLIYVLCCRRNTFETLAVNSVDEDL